MLEPLTVKVVRAVPRGGGGGNATSLPDSNAPAGPSWYFELSLILAAHTF
jgi:hypothetical protein